MRALFYYVFVLEGMSGLGPCGYGTQAGSCHFEISLPLLIRGNRGRRLPRLPGNSKMVFEVVEGR